MNFFLPTKTKKSSIPFIFFRHQLFSSQISFILSHPLEFLQNRYLIIKEIKIDCICNIKIFEY